MVLLKEQVVLKLFTNHLIDTYVRVRYDMIKIKQGICLIGFTRSKQETRKVIKIIITTG